MDVIRRAIERSTERRIQELEAALRRQRELTEQERRRATAAEESARRAWTLSTGRRIEPASTG